jgi:hypothetical protein
VERMKSEERMKSVNDEHSEYDERREKRKEKKREEKRREKINEVKKRRERYKKNL